MEISDSCRSTDDGSKQRKDNHDELENRPLVEYGETEKVDLEVRERDE